MLGAKVMLASLYSCFILWPVVKTCQHMLMTQSDFTLCVTLTTDYFMGNHWNTCDLMGNDASFSVVKMINKAYIFFIRTTLSGTAPDNNVAPELMNF